jgi:hypothetical protein
MEEEINLLDTNGRFIMRGKRWECVGYIRQKAEAMAQS